MSSSGVALSDGRVQNRIENYNQFWQKDLNQEDESGNKNRLEQYTEVVNGTSSTFALSSRQWHPEPTF
jgi:sterol 24-C-methyltransferase